MKLAEALNIRADLQRKVYQLKSRLIANSQVQEGDTPAEDPEDLVKELDTSIKKLEDVIKLINKTNSNTYIKNKSISDMIVERDMLKLKMSAINELVNSASNKVDRYSNKEIKIFSTINVKEKQKELDKMSKEYREIDTLLQGLNWTTDLVE
ncbi:MAG: DIP1984 family protein [Clostridium sp.]|jgi:septicolysin